MKKSKAQLQAEQELNKFLKIVCDPHATFDALTVATLMRKIHAVRHSAAPELAPVVVRQPLPFAPAAKKQVKLI